MLNGTRCKSTRSNLASSAGISNVGRPSTKGFLLVGHYLISHLLLPSKRWLDAVHKVSRPFWLLFFCLFTSTTREKKPSGKDDDFTEDLNETVMPATSTPYRLFVFALVPKRSFVWYIKRYIS